MTGPVLVVTPAYAQGSDGDPLAVAVAAQVQAALLAGADVTVVHLGVEPAVDLAAGETRAGVRCVRVSVGPDPADVAPVLAHAAGDLLRDAALVHVHGLRLATALLELLPRDTRLVVSEHLVSSRGLLRGDGTLPDRTADVLSRTTVLLVPSQDLARRYAAVLRSSGIRAPRIAVLPTLWPPSPRLPRPLSRRAPDGSDRGSDEPAGGESPGGRWLCVGGSDDGAAPDSRELVLRALAVDAAGGAKTRLTVVDEEANAASLLELVAALGVADRVEVLAPERLVPRLVESDTAFDLLLDLDPWSAGEPVLPLALVAGVPAVLARAPGGEPLLDEAAVTGAVRFLPTRPDLAMLLETLAELHDGLGERPADGLPAAAPSWSANLHRGASLLRQHYTDALSPGASLPLDPGGPRVLLVDLASADRNGIGRLVRWVTGLGGEAVVVTAAGPPPASGIPGAVTVDLRGTNQERMRGPLPTLRGRAPRRVRPGIERVVRLYQRLRPPPPLVDAALAGPLAPAGGLSPLFDAAAAADPSGAELAGRWTRHDHVRGLDVDDLLRDMASGVASRAARSSR